jgi:hypothetical protein
MKRVTQLSLTGSLATADAKFAIISLVGGIWRAVSSSIYFTSSSSCCGVSFCCAIACSLRDRVSRRYVRVNVERTTPCFVDSCVQGISSSFSKISHSARASCSVIVALSCGVVKYRCIKRLGALRARTRYLVENSVDSCQRDSRLINKNNPEEEMNFYGYHCGTKSGNIHRVAAGIRD